MQLYEDVIESGEEVSTHEDSQEQVLIVIIISFTLYPGVGHDTIHASRSANALSIIFDASRKAIFNLRVLHAFLYYPQGNLRTEIGIAFAVDFCITTINYPMMGPAFRVAARKGGKYRKTSSTVAMCQKAFISLMDE